MYELLGNIAVALIPGFMVLDLVWGARRFAKSRFWRLRAALVTLAIFLLTGYVALGWGTLFDGVHLLDLSGLGPVGGATVGVLVYEFCHYWYHRSAHRWTWLWRAGHQMHHSAESLDAFGAYFLHPFDASMFTSLQALVFYPLLGITLEAGVIGALFLTFNAMFQHANIRTPHWLGYFIQRPESHNVHHACGIHRYNYADLPLLDIVFGTFRNPRQLDEQPVGFYKGASARIVDMLLGRDVATQPVEEPQRPIRRAA